MRKITIVSRKPDANKVNISQYLVRENGTLRLTMTLAQEANFSHPDYHDKSLDEARADFEARKERGQDIAWYDDGEVPEEVQNLLDKS